MSKRVFLFYENDQPIVSFDASELYAEKYIETLYEFRDFVLDNEEIKNLCSLTNMTDAKVFGENLNETKKVAKQVRPFLTRRAVYGLSTAKLILAKAVNMFAGGTPTKYFQTREEAIAYLLQNE